METVTAQSTPNIALIKYWGNRNNDLRLPAADSLSMVIDTPKVQITVSHADSFVVRSFDVDGAEKPQTEQALSRLEKHWQLTKQYLHSIDRHTGISEHVSLEIHSWIPPAIGIASSAAVFGCLAEAYAGLVQGEELTREQASIIGRLGSGSGARNVFGGFVALKNLEENDMDSTTVESIADEQHWELFDTIIVPSQDEKKVGSTEGHAMAHTSPLFVARLREIPRRMKECTDAILEKDFEKLQVVAEEDSLNMHACMESQNPPIHYLSNETHRIIRELTELRKARHIPLLYTMDAGPTVHVICPREGLGAVQKYAEAQSPLCKIFNARVGMASRLVT